MNKTYQSIAVILALFMFLSCRKEDQRTAEQLERDEIIAIENLLQDHKWGFKDLKVTVAYEAKAIPLLTNVADANGMVAPGTYSSEEIFLNSNRQLYYTYQFLKDDVMVDTSNGENYVREAGYFVINTSEIRINPESSEALRMTYSYDDKYGLFNMKTGTTGSKSFSNAINNRVADAILSDRPSEIADAVVGKLLNNEKLKVEIEQMLYDLIHGKVEEITDKPEHVAQKLTELLEDRLQEIDWEDKLYKLTLELLTKLQVENPEEKAIELAVRIEDKILATLSYQNIYDALLPILVEFEDEKLPVLASQISEAIYILIDQTLSEENIYKKMYPLWESFAGADSNAVLGISDTLSQIVLNRFVDTTELAARFVPFLSNLDDATLLELGDLSNQIINETLKPIVDTINANFPTLHLDPNWEGIQPVLTGALTAIKSSMKGASPEEYSLEFAGTVVNIFDAILPKAFEKALFKLQEIPAEQASIVIAAWLSNLVDMAEEPLINAIAERLNEILALFEAEKIAEELSARIYETLVEVFSEENLYALILPVLETLNEANMERIAHVLVLWLTESGKLDELIDQEELLNKVTEIIAAIVGQVNPDEVTQVLVDAILTSDLLTGVDGEVLNKYLTFKTYKLLLDVSRELNALELIDLTLIKK